MKPLVYTIQAALTVGTHLSSFAPPHVSLPSREAPGEGERGKVQRESSADEREEKSCDICLHGGVIKGLLTFRRHRRNNEQIRAAGARPSPGGWRSLLPLTVDGIEKSSVPKPQRVPGRQEGGVRGH